MSKGQFTVKGDSGEDAQGGRYGSRKRPNKNEGVQASSTELGGAGIKGPGGNKSLLGNEEGWTGMVHDDRL